MTDRYDCPDNRINGQNEDKALSDDIKDAPEIGQGDLLPDMEDTPPLFDKIRVTTGIKDMIFVILFMAVSMIWVDFGLFGGFKLGHSIAFIGLSALMCIYPALSQRPSLMGCFYAACAMAVTLSFTLYNAPAAKALLFVWSGFLMILSLLSNTRNGQRGWKHLFDALKAVLVTPFERMGAMYGSVFAGKGKDSSFKKGVGGALTGVLCAIPALVIIVPLLVSSDAAFETLISGMLFDSLPRLTGSVILGVVLFSLLFTTVFAAAKHIIKSDDGSNITSAANTNVLTSVNSATLISFLSVISLVYAVYLLSQLAYFFNAFAGLLPQGYTPAEYARRGFFEMTVICAINVTVIAVSLIICKKNEKGEAPPAVRALCLFICAFSLVIVSTVVGKLIGYMGTYGLSVLRVYTTLFCIAAAVVIICVAVRLFVRRFAYFRVAVGVLAAMSVVIAFADINTTVARYNYEAYADGRLASIDVDHLATLGDPAVPYLVKLLDDSDKEVAEAAADAIESMAYQYGSVHRDFDEKYSYDTAPVTFEPDDNFDFREYNVQHTIALDTLSDEQVWEKVNQLKN